MPGSWKKRWTVEARPELVREALRDVPRVYAQGAVDGVVGWMGRTYAHQRRDFKPKTPTLTADKDDRMVFQHDLLSPMTYTVHYAPEGQGTRVEVEVRMAGSGKESGVGEQLVVMIYAMTRLLEPRP